MTIDIVKRLRQEIAGYTDGPIEAAEATMREAADEIELLHKQLAHSVDLGNSFMDEIERLSKELARYKYATGVLLTSFNSKWQSRTPAEILRAALEEPQA